MDYRNNCDRITHEGNGLSYNHVIDVLFNEDSSPPAEPVTLSEAKLFCKIDVSDDDTLITAFIKTARQMCENQSNIGFIERSITAIVNNGNGGIFLPYGPIGIVGTIDNIVPLTGQIEGVKWKQLMTTGERITVTYTGGYAVLPDQLKTSLLNAIYYLYDNRSVATEGIGEIARKILKPISRND